MDLRAKLGAGQAYVVGDAGGANRAGEARSEIDSAIRQAKRGTAAPLTNERLPRNQREHTQEYFDAFRRGE